MIRIATKYDIEKILDLLEHFRDTDTTGVVTGSNREYVVNVLNQIIAGAGIVFIAEKDSIVGILVGLISENFWNPKLLEMHELAFWVEPEYRGGTHGFRLLKAYVDYGNELKSKGRINCFYVTKMVDSPDIKYHKFGFKKLEENWVQ